MKKEISPAAFWAAGIGCFVLIALVLFGIIRKTDPTTQAPVPVDHNYNYAAHAQESADTYTKKP